MKKLYYLLIFALVLSSFSLASNLNAAANVWVTVPTCSDSNYSGTVSWNDLQPNAAGFAVNLKSPERSSWYEWGRGVDRGEEVTGQPPYSVAIPGEFHYIDDLPLVLKPGLTYTIKVGYTLAGEIGSTTFNVPKCPTPTPASPTKTPTFTVTKTPSPVSAATCIDDARISSSIPADATGKNIINLTAGGETESFSITATNAGNTKWYDGSYYKLIKTADDKIVVDPSYGHLPGIIDPNGQATWNFMVRPPVAPGTYALSFQMMHSAKGQYIKPNGTKCASTTTDKPFGEVFSINVIAAESPSPSSSFTPIIVDTSSESGGFTEWLGNNWLLIVISLGILATLGITLWLLKRRGAGTLPPPVASESAEPPSTSVS